MEIFHMYENLKNIYIKNSTSINTDNLHLIVFV